MGYVCLFRFFFFPFKYSLTQNFFKVFYKVLFGRGHERLLMCLSIFPEIPSTWPPWQCRVRRTERTRRKYLPAAGSLPLIQRIFFPWHPMVCLEVSCICWRWSWAATAGYGWAKAVRPGFSFCWMILPAVGRRNLLRRWFCLDSTIFLSTSSFRKSKDDGKLLIVSSHFPFWVETKWFFFS